MEKYIYNEQNDLGMSCRAIIIFLVWNYPPKKKKGILVYGGSGICGISESIERCSTPIC